MPPVEIVPVHSKAELDRFIRVPERLLREDPHYIPPLRSERRAALTPAGNPLFQHADVQFWLARRDGEDIGRISAQRDHLLPDTSIGYFGMLAAIDDPAVFAALLETAEQWLRARGLATVQGPFNLSINEEMGALIEGFDTPPMLLMPHDQRHLGRSIAAQGYTKIRDVYAYLCDSTAALPPAAAAMVARGLPASMTLRHMRNETLAADIASLVDIFNDAWEDHWGFVPITREEIAHMAKAMKPLLHERLVWFAEVSGEPAAFGLCLPNLNEAIRDLSGRLMPFGWAKLLWRLKVSGLKSGRVPLMGVRRRYASTILGRLLPLHVVEALRRESFGMGIHSIEIGWVLEDNLPMRHLAEAVGGRHYKTYRVYEKPLSA